MANLLSMVCEISSKKGLRKASNVYHIRCQCWLSLVRHGTYNTFGHVQDLQTNIEEGFDGKSTKRIQELILLR